MKKTFSLLLIVICGFGFIGFVDAATTYEEGVKSNQSIDLKSYNAQTLNETKNASEFIGDFQYGAGYGFSAGTGKFSLIEPMVISLKSTSTSEEKQALIGKFTVFNPQNTNGFVYDYVYKIQSYDVTNDLYNVVKYTGEQGMIASSTYKFDNEKGIFTLTGTPGNTAYADLKGKYVCEEGNVTTCKIMYKVISVDGEKAVVDIYSANQKTTTDKPATDKNTGSTTGNKNTGSTTSNKNGTVQTTANPNTGINDYIIYLVPIALVVGSVIVIRRKHA